MLILFSVSWKYNAQRWCKKRFNNKKTKKHQTQLGQKERLNALAAHFFNNTIDITLPSPNKARDTQMFPIVHWSAPTQMLGAFCSITGGQRDFFWFPTFDKKSNIFLIPLNLLSGSLTYRIQYNFSFIELILKLPHSCTKEGGFLLHLLLLTVILNPNSSPIN